MYAAYEGHKNENCVTRSWEENECEILKLLNTKYNVSNRMKSVEVKNDDEKKTVENDAILAQNEVACWDVPFDASGEIHEPGRY